MPTRRSEWRNPVLNVAAVLFGSGLGFLMMFPLMAIFSDSLRIPGVGTLFSDISRWSEVWAAVMFGLVSWIAGVAATYAIIARAIKPKPDSLSDQAN